MAVHKVEAINGSDIVLQCFLRGNFKIPEWQGPPSYKYYAHQGSKILNNAIQSVLEGRLIWNDNDMDLNLRNVTDSDAGSYKCQYAEIGEFRFDLVVLGIAPTLPALTTTSSATVTKESTQSFPDYTYHASMNEDKQKLWMIVAFMLLVLLWILVCSNVLCWLRSNDRQYQIQASVGRLLQGNIQKPLTLIFLLACYFLLGWVILLCSVLYTWEKHSKANVTEREFTPMHGSSIPRSESHIENGQNPENNSETDDFLEDLQKPSIRRDHVHEDEASFMQRETLVKVEATEIKSQVSLDVNEEYEVIGQQIADLKAKNGMTISLVIASIAKHKADVLVVPTTPDLKLSNTKASNFLVMEGGPDLQEECNLLYPNGIRPGQIACIRSGNLPCACVYLINMSTWSADDTSKAALYKVVTDCLKLASIHKFFSVAFSSLEIGCLRYQVDIMACTMNEAVIKFDLENMQSSVQAVHFVCHDEDVVTVEAFEKEILMFRDGGKPTPFYAQGHVNFEVKQGDILEQTTNAIVCSVGKDFDFNGAVAQALKKKCPDLVEHCKSLKGDLTKNNVVTTHSRGLSAEFIIFVQWVQGMKSWQSQIKKCLIEAENNHCKSLAFPVLGSSAKASRMLPADMFKCMHAAIVNYVNEHKCTGTAIDTVQLIVFDRSMLNVIEMAILGMNPMALKNENGEWILKINK